MKKLRFLSLVGLTIFLMTVLVPQTVYAGRGDGRRNYWRDGRRHHRDYRYHRYRPTPRKEIRIRFTDRDIDRLIVIGGIYFLSKAISEAGERAREREVVYVYPPPPQYIYVPAPPPQPTYTPLVSTTVVTVRNATNWYIKVSINGTELDLYPGYEQAVSWTYTGRGQYVEARAYQDRYYNRLVGTYQGNLVGYQIPWRLNFDYGSFVLDP